MSELLRAKQVHKSFRVNGKGANEVLRDVSVTIDSGEFLAIMGASGSGKSTLLYSVSGMDDPTSGEVYFKGASLAKLKESERAALRLQEMGFVFQHIHLLKNLSIFDNVILSGYLSGIRTKAEVNARARELLERTGIPELADRMITEVSGGQLQRAGICRALINEPAILFGDEPTGALNSQAAAEILELLTEINRGGTALLIVTHDPRVAAHAHRVAVMKDGRIEGDHHLGPIGDTGDSGEVGRREALLSDWLREMGV